MVVKNIIDKEILAKYQRELSGFIEAIRNNTLSLDGTTTFGEKYYLKTIGSDEVRVRPCGGLWHQLVAREGASDGALCSFL